MERKCHIAEEERRKSNSVIHHQVFSEQVMQANPKMLLLTIDHLVHPVFDDVHNLSWSEDRRDNVRSAPDQQRSANAAQNLDGELVERLLVNEILGEDVS